MILIDHQPTRELFAEETAPFKRVLRRKGITDDDWVKVAALVGIGLSGPDIAYHLKCGLRTVRRKLGKVYVHLGMNALPERHRLPALEAWLRSEVESDTQRALELLQTDGRQKRSA